MKFRSGYTLDRAERLVPVSPDRREVTGNPPKENCTYPLGTRL